MLQTGAQKRRDGCQPSSSASPVSLCCIPRAVNDILHRFRDDCLLVLKIDHSTTAHYLSWGVVEDVDNVLWNSVLCHREPDKYFRTICGNGDSCTSVSDLLLSLAPCWTFSLRLVWISSSSSCTMYCAKLHFFGVIVCVCASHPFSFIFIFVYCSRCLCTVVFVSTCNARRTDQA